MCLGARIGLPAPKSVVCLVQGSHTRIAAYGHEHQPLRSGEPGDTGRFTGRFLLLSKQKFAALNLLTGSFLPILFVLNFRTTICVQRSEVEQIIFSENFFHKLGGIFFLG